MDIVATSLWAAGLAATVISVALDRAPTLLKHGGPFYAFVFLFALPTSVAFATVATELDWWICSLAAVAAIVLATIIAAAKQKAVANFAPGARR